jgi:Flp pilus assembly protein TadB
MQDRYQRRVRITVRDVPGEIEPPGLLAKIFAAMIGAVALVVAFMFSVVALAVVAVIIMIAVIYVWWKTRDLRRNLRENPPGGRVIDGDAINDRD